MIFRLVQRNFDILGISRTQSIFAFYAKVFFAYLLLGSSIISHFKFLFRDDITFEEYTQSIYVTTIAVTTFLTYTVIIRDKDEFFKHIDNLESKIQQFKDSESKCASFNSY